MGKTVRLAESDLIKIVNRVIREQNMSQGIDSGGDKYNISSPYKVGQTLKGRRSTDGKVYTLKVVKVGQGWAAFEINGPGRYENLPINYGSHELTTKTPGELSGNMEMGTFKIVK
jgi:hypothetical protein